jgi:UDP-glucose 4-epimerase
MRVIVTGSTGFVGKHLVPILQENHKVICVSKTGTSNLTKTINIDISEAEQVATLPNNIDCLVHLAAYVPSNQSSADIFRCDAVNSRGTMNLLQYAVDNDIEKFVYISSCHYLESEQFEGEVRYDINPKDNYEASKYGGEIFCRAYRDAYGLNTTTLRSSYIYGPGMQRDTVLYKFLEKSLNDDPITLNNGGSDRTDFLYVKDLIRAIRLAIDGASGEFVVGSQECSTILDLAEVIVSVTGSDSKLHIEEQTNPPNDFFVHSDDIGDELGYHPRFGLRDGIRAMVTELNEFDREVGN